MERQVHRVAIAQDQHRNRAPGFQRFGDFPQSVWGIHRLVIQPSDDVTTSNVRFSGRTAGVGYSLVGIPRTDTSLPTASKIVRAKCAQDTLGVPLK